jgi:hypothetical protein
MWQQGAVSRIEAAGRLGMALRADFVLSNRGRRLIALVEAKNKRGTTPDWAAQYRHNMVSHGEEGSGAEFFILATPDRLYIWQGTAYDPDLIQPTYVVDARPIFGPYYETAGRSPEAAGSNAFRLVVLDWMSGLTRLTEPTAAADGQSWLIDSGLLSRVQDGRISYPDAA